MDLKSIINKSTIVVSFHYHTYGPSEALVEFLREQKTNRLLVIRHPLFSKSAKYSIIEEYQAGYLTKQYKFKMTSYTLITHLIETVITIFATILLVKESKYVVFIGFNPVNAVAGILCKLIKKVNYVIMHSHMYHLTFNGYLSNFLYQLFHRLSLHKSDKIWCVSKLLAQIYIRKFMVNPNKILVVPNGVKLDFMHRSIKEERKIEEKLRIIFVGDLSERSGIKLLIDAMASLPPEILFKLEITVIGDGPYKPILENFVRKNNLDKLFNIVGLVEHQKVMRLLPLYDVGLALYPPHLFSKEWAADPIKPKEYLASGLALIVTRVPWTLELSTDVKLFNAGIVINYNLESLIQALKILLEPSKVEKLKEGAKKIAQKYDNWNWASIFKRAFEDTFKATLYPQLQ